MDFTVKINFISINMTHKQIHNISSLPYHISFGLKISTCSCFDKLCTHIILEPFHECAGSISFDHTLKLIGFYCTLAETRQCQILISCCHQNLILSDWANK